MPLFSIITITKKNPHGFRRTSESVENQTFKNFEWIVIDGEREPDNGIYDAMNKGIERSCGDYMVFMNAGDTFADASTLQLVANAVGADFIYGDALEGSHLKPARPRSHIARGMITHHQAMYFGRSALRYDTKYKIAADYKFTAQTLAEAERVTYLPTPLCVFEAGGVSQQRADLGRREQAMIRKELGLKAPLFTGALQAAATATKNHAPEFYWFLRKRLKTLRA